MRKIQYSFKHLSSSQKRNFLLIVLLAIIIQGVFLSTSFIIKKNRQLSNAQLFGKSISTSISLIINDVVTPTHIIKNLYLQYGDVIFSSFDQMCERFMKEDKIISSLYIAPDGVIQVAYPPSVRDTVVGFKMFEDPDQKGPAILAYETRKATLAGPHNLVEGGVGFIIRNPIFDGDDFKAFTIAVIDWGKFVNQLISRLDSSESGYNFAIWKEDSSHIVTDKYGFIINSGNNNLSRQIDIPVYITNDEWHLCVEPIDGWVNYFCVWKELLASALIVVIILSMTYYNMCETVSRINALKYDDLTGVRTRMSLYEYIDTLKFNDPYGEYDILVADIENFKVINSIYGTEACDDYLKYIAREFKKKNSFGRVARYGGDQFIVIFPSSTNIGKAEFEKQAIELQENAPIKNVNIKYGFYGFIDLSLPPNLICDRALTAARSILHNYDEIVANWNGVISQQSTKETLFESEFKNAIENEEFKVWFQPKFDARTEKVVGSEALLRWIKKDGTIVSPLDFIHVFEEDGLIVQLDEYVFRKVCSTLKSLIEGGNPVYPVSVNLSRTSLVHKNTVSNYAEIVKEYGIPIHLVPLEITETTKTRDFAIKEIVEDFKSYGFEIHMDDFGSGLSSMESLNILPFDVVKLDKSLIDYIGDPGGNELIRHCIELAHFKELKIVAEGVEKKEQLDFLRELNCDYIQGYYYSAPLSYEDTLLFFMKLYRENRT